MAFHTSVGDEIEIGGVLYEFGPHPAAPSLPYGQEGRQGVVYQLRPRQPGSPHAWKALKVFRPKFRTPSLVYQSEIFESFAGLPGLTVCERLVLTPEKHAALLKEHHDLLYAVVMPWIDGPTWMDILLEKEDLNEEQCRRLAIGLAEVLSMMEQRCVAHCDLSSPNVLLPCLSESGIGAEASPIQLVDVEGLFNSKLNKPDILPGGSPGYAAHRTAPSGLWGHQADRFAGAVLLAEMLGWADPAVKTHAWAESYFEPGEMQQPGERYDVLVEALRKHAGDAVVRLFTQAWQSEELHQCPTFGEWLMILLDLDAEKTAQKKALQETSSKGPEQANGDAKTVSNNATSQINITERVNHLLAEGKKLEDAKDWEAALAVYRKVLDIIPVLSTQAQELQIIMSRIEMMLDHRKPDIKTGDLLTGDTVVQGDTDNKEKQHRDTQNKGTQNKGTQNKNNQTKNTQTKATTDNRSNTQNTQTTQTQKRTQAQTQTQTQTKTVKKQKSGVKIFFITTGWLALGLVVIFLILFFIGLTHPSA